MLHILANLDYVAIGVGDFKVSRPTASLNGTGACTLLETVLVREFDVITGHDWMLVANAIEPDSSNLVKFGKINRGQIVNIESQPDVAW